MNNNNHKPPNPNRPPCPPRWLDDDPSDPFELTDDGPPYRPPRAQSLVFSPLAWLKLQFFLHAGDTEVAGFGISDAADLLYIDDFLTIKQWVTPVTVQFDDHAVADYVDGCVDAGLQLQHFMRIWCHTHPGVSPHPSFTDEETFGRVFGNCDWSVMFIIGRTGQTYARLSFSAGPAGNILLPVTVDWERWPTVAIEQIDKLTGLTADWIAEFAANIKRRPARRLGIAAEEPGAGEGFEPLEPLGAGPAEPQNQPAAAGEKPDVPR